ncbi:MAG: ZIP family metal transporter [Candidatus Doudnabacteria bacterium]|nr:ZIP family metal transporter [Candidatus Doudnabacteria bacterium]
MQTVALYSIISALIVSLMAFIGLLVINIQNKLARKSLILLVSFAAGALLGDVFIHLLPELAKQGSLGLKNSLYILATIVVFYIIEKYIHWHHHPTEGEEDTHLSQHLVTTNLIGDGIHNFIDGMIIAGSYLVDIRLGLATTLAVILHEIPQEFGDFGVLIYAGLSKVKALFYNFLSGLAAVLGVIVALLATNSENIVNILISIGIGSFIYIATADLIPETHKQKERFLPHLVSFVLGIVVMYLLLFID